MTAPAATPSPITVGGPPISATLPFRATPTIHVEIPPEGYLPTEPAAVPVLNESRRLTLEFPPAIRLGDSEVVRLTLEVDALGNLTPTAEVAGNAVSGKTVEIPDLYDTHIVFAEARIDMAGVEVRPADTISEALLPGGSATFYWSLRPTRAGTFRGTVWLHLHFVDRSSRAETRIAVSAQPLQVEAGRLFGLSGSVARTAGGIGSVVGAILGFPFIDDLIKWLIRRRPGSRQKS